MKILVISNLYPEPEGYGIAPDTKAVHFFAKEWLEMGHEVLVIHPYWNPIGKISRQLNIRNHQVREYSIDSVPVIFGESQILVPHKNCVSKIQQFVLSKRIKKYMTAHYPFFSPDLTVVHFPMLVLTFVKPYLTNKHSSCTLHGVDIRSLSAMTQKKRGFFVDSLNGKYSNILYRSKVLSAQGREFGLKEATNNLILSGIDENLIAPIEDVQIKLSDKNNSLRLIYAGKLNKQKRIDSIIYALFNLKCRLPFHLTIVGEGPEMNSLQDLTETLDLCQQISFIGKKSRSDVSALMRNSDVFVMVSKGETLGLVYLEAMGQGCIPIGSKGEGIDGVIKDSENGFLCNPDDVKALAEKIETIYKMPRGQRADIAQKAYDTVRDMTSRNMAIRYLDLMAK